MVQYLRESSSVLGTDDIGTLLDLLPDDMEVPEHVEDAAVLTEYAVMSRYPSASEPVEEEELMEAVGLAGRVLSRARAKV